MQQELVLHIYLVANKQGIKTIRLGIQLFNPDRRFKAPRQKKPIRLIAQWLNGNC